MTWQILVGCNLNIIFTLGVLQIIVLNQYHVVLVEQSFYFVSHKNIKDDPPSPLHSWVIDYNIQYLYNFYIYQMHASIKILDTMYLFISTYAYFR
jgi:hypothetical protein